VWTSYWNQHVGRSPNTHCVWMVRQRGDRRACRRRHGREDQRVLQRRHTIFGAMALPRHMEPTSTRVWARRTVDLKDSRAQGGAASTTGLAMPSPRARARTLRWPRRTSRTRAPRPTCARATGRFVVGRQRGMDDNARRWLCATGSGSPATKRGRIDASCAAMICHRRDIVSMCLRQSLSQGGPSTTGPARST